MSQPKTTEFYAQSPDGERRRVVIRVGPVQSCGNEYRCSLAIDGLESPDECVGASYFQALSMAVWGVRETLIQRLMDGWCFYASEQDTEPFDALYAWFNEEGERYMPASVWRRLTRRCS